MTADSRTLSKTRRSKRLELSSLGVFVGIALAGYSLAQIRDIAVA
jgi:hypothetical protein